MQKSMQSHRRGSSVRVRNETIDAITELTVLGEITTQHDNEVNTCYDERETGTQ